MYNVAIDIGHAHNTGAQGNGYHEHTQCAKIAAALKHKLESYKLAPIHADIIDHPQLTNSTVATTPSASSCTWTLQAK